MLSNIIGILVAFVAVMLLLSLLVTSLVQFTQATLRLRARNLLFGVGALLEQIDPNLRAPADASALRPNPHRAVAAHVLNNADASIKTLPEPNSILRVLMGPPVSWVQPRDLVQAMANTAALGGRVAPHPAVASAAPGAAAAVPAAGIVAPSAAAVPGAAPPGVPAGSAPVPAADVEQTFENMQPALSKRFQFIMRVVTVICALLVAFAFQVSAPELLRTLPSTEAKREAILAAVPNLTSDATRKLAYSSDNFLEQAIKALSGKFSGSPECLEEFDEVSGDADSKEVMMQEMRAVLHRCPQREAVLREYSSIIDELSNGAAKSAYDNAAGEIDQLNSLGFSLKLDDFSFYASRADGGSTKGSAAADGTVGPKAKCVIHWNHILGVIITAILLSLGAPFWFQQLKNLSSLQDFMNPKAGKTAQGSG